MRTAFIASEYNPFHNGHKYHIEKTKEYGAEAVICVMSGNFVQRGEIAIAEKHLRAKAALMCGADLVIELPLKYAVSTASYFAKGFIDTVKATGLGGVISFGASCSIDELKAVKDLIYSDECIRFTNDKISEGLSFPAAKALFLKENFPQINIDLLNDANNILSLEYMNAADASLTEAEYFAIERFGASHDSDITSGGFSSAGFIRRCLADTSDGIKQIKDFVPRKVFEFYDELFREGLFLSDNRLFNKICFAKLIDFDAEYFKEINNVTGGIENRIVESVKNSDDLNTLYDSIKSKHLTHSRVRQIILSSVLGIKKSDLETGVSYIRVLGFNNTGRKLLHNIKESSTLPVISNLSQADKSIPAICRDAYLDYKAAKLFNLCQTNARFNNPEYQIPPVYLR